ncbi:UPF0648 protein [Smittium mucronatum]|uniref:UPF0648 protein n=1 Tax=Smittium mucronatum TaxID=133383 RepID=A0A1R0GPL6_9FUNG|nr:UPF0648 protein [Smittium mucronatum]
MNFFVTLRTLWSLTPFYLKYSILVFVIWLFLWDVTFAFILSRVLKVYFDKKGITVSSFHGLSANNLKCTISSKSDLKIHIRIKRISVDFYIFSNIKRFIFDIFRGRKESSKVEGKSNKHSRGGRSKKEDAAPDLTDRFTKTNTKNNALRITRKESEVKKRFIRINISNPIVHVFIHDKKKTIDDFEINEEDKTDSNPEAKPVPQEQLDEEDIQLVSIEHAIELITKKVKSRIGLFSNLAPIIYPLLELDSAENFINISKNEDSWISGDGIALHFPLIRVNGESLTKDGHPLGVRHIWGVIYNRIRTKFFPKKSNVDSDSKSNKSKKKFQHPVPNKASFDENINSYSDSSEDSNSDSEASNYKTKSDHFMENKIVNSEISFSRTFSVTFSDFKILTNSKSSDSTQDSKSKSVFMKFISGLRLSLNSKAHREIIADLVRMEVLGKTEFRFSFQTDDCDNAKKINLGFYCDPISLNNDGLSAISSEIKGFFSQDNVNQDSNDDLFSVIKNSLPESDVFSEPKFSKDFNPQVIEDNLKELKSILVKNFKEYIQSLQKQKSKSRKLKILLYKLAYFSKLIQIFELQLDIYFKSFVYNISSNVIKVSDPACERFSIRQKDVYLGFMYSADPSSDVSSKSKRFALKPDSGKINAQKPSKKREVLGEVKRFLHKNKSAAETPYSDDLQSTGYQFDPYSQPYENEASSAENENSIVFEDYKLPDFNVNSNLKVLAQVGSFCAKLSKKKGKNHSIDIVEDEDAPMVAFPLIKLSYETPVNFFSGKDLEIHTSSKSKFDFESPLIKLNLEFLLVVQKLLSSLAEMTNVKSLNSVKVIKPSYKTKMQNLVNENFTFLLKKQYNEIWESHKSRIFNFFKMTEIVELFLRDLQFVFSISNFRVEILTKTFPDQIQVTKEMKNLIFYFKDTTLDLNLENELPKNSYDIVASIKKKAILKLEMSPLLVFYDNEMIQKNLREDKQYQVQYILGNNGVSSTGEIDLLFGYCYDYFDGNRPYVRSNFSVDLGIFSLFLGGDNAFQFFNWVPIWTLALGLSSNVKNSDNKTQPKTTEEVHPLKKGSVSTIDPSLEKSFYDLIKTDVFTNFYSKKENSVKVFLKEFRASFSSFDGEFDFQNNFLHGISIFVRNMQLDVKVSSDILGMNVTSSNELGQASAFTFNCVKSSTRKNTLFNLNYIDYFDALGWKIMNNEEIFIINDIKLNSNFSNRDRTSQHKLKIDSHIKSATFIFSASSYYRIFLLIQQFSLLKSFSSKIVKKKSFSKAKSDVCIDLSMEFDRATLRINFPKADVHDGATKELIIHSGTNKDVNIVFDMPMLKIATVLNKSDSDDSFSTVLNSPNIGIFDFNHPGDALGTFTIISIELKKPKPSEKLPKEKEVIKPKMKVLLKYDLGCISVPHDYDYSHIIDSISYIIKLIKSLKKMKKRFITSYTNQVNLIMSKGDFGNIKNLSIHEVLKNLYPIINIPLISFRSDLITFIKSQTPLSSPDLFPRIEIIAKSFSFFVLDDPFEIAISRIYRCGKIENAQRLARLDAYEKKLSERNSSHDHNHDHDHDHSFSVPPPQKSDPIGAQKNTSQSNMTGDNKGSLERSFSDDYLLKHDLQSPTSDSASVFTNSGSHSEHKKNHREGVLGNILHGKQITIDAIKHSAENIKHSAENIKHSAENINIRDSKIVKLGAQLSPKLHLPKFLSDGDKDSSHGKHGAHRKKSGNHHFHSKDPNERYALESKYRLDEFESKIWIKSIRKFMIRNNDYDDGDDFLSDVNVEGLGISSINNPDFSVSVANDSGLNHTLFENSQKIINGQRRNRTQIDQFKLADSIIFIPTNNDKNPPQSPSRRVSSFRKKPPYPFKHGVRRYPNIPLMVLSFTPLRVIYRVPDDLTKFEQIEGYLREIDPSMPLNQLWSTLIPINLRLKAGEFRVQLRDYQAPLLYFPDPFKSKIEEDIDNRHQLGYSSFRGGVSIEGGFVISEQAAHSGALRLFTIPICSLPYSVPPSYHREMDIMTGQLSESGQYVLRLPIVKSLTFPRVHCNFSIVIFTSATTQAEKALRFYNSGDKEGLNSLGVSYEELSQIMSLNRLPTQSPMICWYQRVQPVLSDVSQRIEKMTSTTAEPSPHLGWWDKIRSRFTIMFRLACVDIKLSELAIKDNIKDLENTKSDHSLSFNIQTEQTGEFLLYILGGRDPYSFSIRNSGYLISLQGDVRISVGEGNYYDAGKNKAFNKEYVVDLGDFCDNNIGTAPVLNDVIILRSRKFTTSIPEVMSSGLETLTLMEQRLYHTHYMGFIDKYHGVLNKDVFELVLMAMAFPDFTSMKMGTLASDINLYKKPLASLTRGVRVSIGFATTVMKSHGENYIFDQIDSIIRNPGLNSDGLIDSHWNIMTHAPENIPIQYRKNYDAYDGFRSLGIHFGLGILCPYELEDDDISQNSLDSRFEANRFSNGPRKTIMSVRSPPYDGDGSAKKSFIVPKTTIPDIVVSNDSFSDSEISDSNYSHSSSSEIHNPKSPINSSINQIDDENINYMGVGKIQKGRISSLYATGDFNNLYDYNSHGSEYFYHNTQTHGSPILNQEDFGYNSLCENVMCSISPLHRCKLERSHIGGDFICGFITDKDKNHSPDNGNSPYSSGENSRVYSSMLSTDMFMGDLHLFSSKLMLPTRKGKLYPDNESTDIKFGKSLLSFRAGLDLSDFQLSYTRQTSEVKEFEFQELHDLFSSSGLSKDTVDGLLSSFRRQNAEDDSLPLDPESKIKTELASPSKAEGSVFQLKARTKVIQGNLLMVQKRERLLLGERDVKSKDADSKGDDLSSKHSAVSEIKPKKADEISLNWSIQESEAEVDDFDVRIIKMDYKIPLFMDFLPVGTSLPDSQWDSLTHNGMHIVQETLNYLKIHPEKLDWVDDSSLYDLGSFDLGNAIFSNIDVFSFLWAPRMVYFIQSNIQAPPIPLDIDSIEPSKNLSFDNPFTGEQNFLSDHYYVKLSDSRPNVPLEPEEYDRYYINREPTEDNSESDALTELRVRTGLTNTGLPNDEKSFTMSSLVRSSIRKSVSHKLRSINIRRSTTLKSLSRKRKSVRFNKADSIKTHSISQSENNGSHYSSDELSSSEDEDILTKSLDFKKILRDSRLTQSLLLSRRKERLGYVIKHYEIKGKMNMDDFEHGLYTSSLEYRNEMVKNADEILQLSIRRKLINKCLDMLDLDSNSNFGNPEIASSQEKISGLSHNTDDDSSSQGLESLFRHRFLLHSAYLVWNSRIRDAAFRFFYNEDDFKALKYFLSQSASQVVHELDKKNKKDYYSKYKANNNNLDSSKDEREYSNYDDDFESHVDKIAGEDSESTDYLDTGYNGYFNGILDKDGLNYTSEKKDAAKLLKDFQNFTPKYSALIEFLNSQVSLIVDENSEDSMVATAEKAQLHIIQLCSNDDSNESISSIITPVDFPSTSSSSNKGSNFDQTLSLKNSSVLNQSSEFDASSYIGSVSSISIPKQSIVKTRMLFEMKNMQLFYLRKKDFIDCPLYLMDCFYGSHVDISSLSSTLWPAWIPIEILLTPESIEDNFIPSNQNKDDELVKSGSLSLDPKDTLSNAAKERAPRYSKMLDPTSGMVIFDRMNTQRIQKDNNKPNEEKKEGVSGQGHDQDTRFSKSFHFNSNSSLNNTGNINSTEKSGKDYGNDQRSFDIGSMKNTYDDEMNIRGSQTHKADHAKNYIQDSDSSNAVDECSSILISMPKINVSLTSEQFASALNVVFGLMIYNEPERSQYLENLSVIKLTTDLSSISEIGPLIYRIQESLRIRKGMLQVWCQKQWKSNRTYGLYGASVQFDSQDSSNPTATGYIPTVEANKILSSTISKISSADIKESASYGGIVLALSRQIRVLEQQLRVSMDLVSAAEKLSSSDNSITKKSSSKITGNGDLPNQKGISKQREMIKSKMSNVKNSIPILGDDQTRMLDRTASSNSNHTDLTESVNGRRASLITSPSRNVMSNVVSWGKKIKRSGRNKSVSSHISDHKDAYSTLGNPRDGDDHKMKLSKLDEDPNHQLDTKPSNNVFKLDFTKRHSIAMHIGISISSVNWRILDNDEEPICDIKLRNLSISFITSSSLASDIFINADLIIMLNRIENSMYSEILMPYVPEKTKQMDFSKDKMLRINYSELPPVGGINIVELLEIDLSPIRVQLSKDVTTSLTKYFFFFSDDDDIEDNIFKQINPFSSGSIFEDGKSIANTSMIGDSASVLTIPKDENGKPILKNSKNGFVFSNPLNKKSNSQRPSPNPLIGFENFQQMAMQTKASENKTFITVRIPGHRHCISYHGSKRNNLMDLHNFVFKAPTLEYRNEVFTYYQLLMHVKKAFINAALSHTGALLKEKVKQLQGSRSTKKTYDDSFAKQLVKEIDESDTASINMSGSGYQPSIISQSKISANQDEKKNGQAILSAVPTSLFAPVPFNSDSKKHKHHISKSNLRKVFRNHESSRKKAPSSINEGFLDNDLQSKGGVGSNSESSVIANLDENKSTDPNVHNSKNINHPPANI